MYVPTLSSASLAAERARARSVHGLGLLEPTAGGLAVRGSVTCLTAAEQKEAQEKCAPPIHLRGLGQMASRSTPMAGRLTGMDPCAVKDLPVCPTPKCLDDATIGMIVGCAKGTPPAGVNCSDPWTAWTILALATLPFCKRPAQLMVPTCLTQDQLAMMFYCQRYPKFDGPDKAKNAQCWLMTHDPAYWSAYQSKLLCPVPAAKAPPVIVEPPRPPAPRPPPVIVEPPRAPAPKPVVAKPPVAKPPVAVKPPPVVVVPPGITPPPMIQPEELPPEAPVKQAGIGVGGLLAIAAGVAVGGWLLFGKKKKKLPTPAAA